MTTIVATTIRLLKIYDLLPLDWETGKRLPIEAHDMHLCARCGKLHAKVYVVEADSTQYEVGATCCKRLFGWEPSHEEVMHAEAVARDQAVQAALQKLAQPLIEQITSQPVPVPSYVRCCRGLRGYDYGFAADGVGIWVETTDRTARHPPEVVIPQAERERFANLWKHRQICLWISAQYSHWPKAKQKKLEFGLLELLGLHRSQE